MVLRLTMLSSAEEIKQFLANGGNFIFLYGPACAPCQRLKPLLFQYGGLLSYELHLGMIDAQKHRDLRGQFGCQKIPFVWSNGAGLQSSDAEKVQAFIEQHSSSFDMEVDF